MFKLHACCFPVKGAERSLIYDIQRGSYEFIPNDLYEMLINYNSVVEIKKSYDNQVVDEYFAFLEEKEFITYLDGDFPEIDLSFRFPGVVSNAVIAVPEKRMFGFERVIGQLSELGCRDIQLIYPFDVKLETVMEDLSYLQSFKSIEIITPFLDKEHEIVSLVKEEKRIAYWLLHSAPESRLMNEPYYGIQSVFSTIETFDHRVRCALRDESFFNISMTLFTEAHHYNVFYNGKVCIDERGEVQNAFWGPTFGNINETALEEIISGNFKDIWLLKKDDIEGCRECEFRYMCPDNRLDLKESCKYNPYTMEWK